MKRIEPQSGVSVGNLYFAHTGWHYMAMRPVAVSKNYFVQHRFDF